MISNIEAIFVPTSTLDPKELRRKAPAPRAPTKISGSEEAQLLELCEASVPYLWKCIAHQSTEKRGTEAGQFKADERCRQRAIDGQRARDNRNGSAGERKDSVPTPCVRFNGGCTPLNDLATWVSSSFQEEPSRA